MHFSGCSHKPEAWPDCAAQRVGIISADIETAAIRRSILGERRDNEVPPLRYSSPGQFAILAAVRGLGQEVEHGPVVPDIEPANILRLGDIGHNPFDTPGTHPQSSPCLAQGGFRNVKNSDFLEGKVKQPIDEDGGSPTNVDDSAAGRRSNRPNELK